MKPNAELLSATLLVDESVERVLGSCSTILGAGAGDVALRRSHGLMAEEFHERVADWRGTARLVSRRERCNSVDDRDGVHVLRSGLARACLSRKFSVTIDAFEVGEIDGRASIAVECERPRRRARSTPDSGRYLGEAHLP